jgi:hypothetical protein
LWSIPSCSTSHEPAAIGLVYGEVAVGRRAGVTGAGRFFGIPVPVWFLGAMSSLLTLTATRHGPGLSADSVVYLAAGIHLADSDGLRTVTGHELTLFPPGLSVVSAIGEWAGVPAQQAVRWLNVVGAGSVVVGGHVLLRRLPLRRGVLLGATTWLAVSPVLLGVSQMAWSELPFIVATVLALVMLGGIVERRHLSGWELSGLVSLCWLAFAFRYAGLVLVAVAVVVLVGSLWRSGHAGTLRVGLFGALACSFPVAWMMRNQAVDGTWMGPRPPSPDTVPDVAGRVALTVGQWFVPFDFVPLYAAAVIGLLVLGGLAVASVFVWRAMPSGPSRHLVVGLGPAVLFALVYLGAISVGQLSTAFDRIDSRLLSPVHVPVVLVVAVAASELADRLGTRTRGAALGTVAAAVGVAFLFAQFLSVAQQARASATTGIGYNSKAWEHSGLAAATVAVTGEGDVEVVTNQVSGLWAATGLQPLRRAPRFAGVRDLPVEGELEDFADEVACARRPLVLAMFGDGDPRTHPVGQLRRFVALEAIADADDGQLYRIRARRPCPSPVP